MRHVRTSAGFRCRASCLGDRPARKLLPPPGQGRPGSVIGSVVPAGTGYRRGEACRRQVEQALMYSLCPPPGVISGVAGRWLRNVVVACSPGATSLLVMTASGTGSAWCARVLAGERLPFAGLVTLAAGSGGLGAGGPWHPRAMDKALVPVRDLTDCDQNQAVLDVASALAGGRAAGRVAGSHGPAVAAEAVAAARSRRRLGELAGAGPPERGVGHVRRDGPHGPPCGAPARGGLRTGQGPPARLADRRPARRHVEHHRLRRRMPDRPSSADVMTDIAGAGGYPGKGHRSVTVLRLAEVIGGDIPVSPASGRLISAGQSRKGGSVLAGLAAAAGTDPARPSGAGRHVVCYTDADLSANLAQLGSLAAPVVAGDKVAGALGQRYGIDGAVLVRADGPVTEPHSTGDKPDKIIILFRHFVRALLIPPLAHVLDTQAGFKAFDAAALGPAIRQMASFNETFDVELLIHLAQHYGPQALAVEPIVFTEDFAATNFPSAELGPRHLTMVHQVVELYDRLVAPIAPSLARRPT